MEIRHLSVRLGKTEILKDIDFSLQPNEIVVLLGRNGSGKTTLLRSLAGSFKLQPNTISDDEGNDLSSLDEKKRSKLIAYLPQNLPRPSISVEELVSYGRYPYTSMGRFFKSEDLEKVSSSLEKVGLADKKNRLVCHLSGGERSMAYFGLINASDCPYLFLDEPFASLDIPARGKLISLLRLLKKEGKCIFLSVHDLLLALEIADRIILLDEGRLIEDSPLPSFLENKNYESIFQVLLLTAKDEKGNSYYVCKRKE